MKIVATNQAATNVDATQILQDRAARLQGEGARPRKLQEADATADRALKALEALPGSRYDAAAVKTHLRKLTVSPTVLRDRLQLEQA